MDSLRFFYGGLGVLVRFLRFGISNYKFYIGMEKVVCVLERDEIAYRIC